MRVIGNVLWLLLGGLELAAFYVLGGLLAFVLVVTIPFGIAAFRLAGFALWPFGRVLVRRPDAGVATALGNLLWALVAGIWLALGHVVAAVLVGLTIVGIPFALAHLKLARAALTPLGHAVVPADRVPAGVTVTVAVAEFAGPSTR